MWLHILPSKYVLDATHDDTHRTRRYEVCTNTLKRLFLRWACDNENRDRADERHGSDSVSTARSFPQARIEALLGGKVPATRLLGYIIRRTLTKRAVSFGA